MARPIKNVSTFHKHDANFRNTVAILKLRSKFGLVGYGAYIMFLEYLDSCEDFKLKVSNENISDVSKDFKIDLMHLKEIINYCCKREVGLLTYKGGFIYSETHIESQQDILKQRQYKRQYNSLNVSEYEENDNNSIDNYIALRTVEFNKLDADLLKILKVKCGIERPMVWANRRIPVQYFDIVQCFVKIREDKEWRGRLQADNNLTKEQLLNKLFDFVKNIVGSKEYLGYDGYDSSDGKNNLIKHFTYWLKKNI